MGSFIEYCENLNESQKKINKIKGEDQSIQKFFDYIITIDKNATLDYNEGFGFINFRNLGKIKFEFKGGGVGGLYLEFPNKRFLTREYKATLDALFVLDKKIGNHQ